MSLSDIRLIQNADFFVIRMHSPALTIQRNTSLDWRIGQETGVTNDMSVMLIKKHNNGQLINIANRYLIRILSLTDFTSLTLRAASIALLILVCELTKLVSWTTPLKVSTLISADFRGGLVKNCRFDFRGDNSIIKILPGSRLLCGWCATQTRNYQDSQ